MAAVAILAAVAAPAARLDLPAQLSDREFWALSSELSEPDGYFRSDNLVSNEAAFQHVIPDLIERTSPGQVYLGVGPEQNFTYIAAVKPRMVFIVDVRRGNMNLHLMYKALFELSPDRVTFVGRLFSRARPAGLSRTSTPGEIFAAYAGAPTDETLYRQNLDAILTRLTKTRGLVLAEGDRDGIEFVYRAFFENGPHIMYSAQRGAAQGGFGRGSMPTYADLMTATDAQGVARSYLADEERFGVLRALHLKNMVVPVVGNFGGTKALQAVGAYVKKHGGTVTAFYLSNVEQYLGGLRPQFCANVAALPLDKRSTFIRSTRGGRTGGGMFMSGLLPMREGLQACVNR